MPNADGTDGPIPKTSAIFSEALLTSSMVTETGIFRIPPFFVCVTASKEEGIMSKGSREGAVGRRLNGFLGLSLNDRTLQFLAVLLDKTVPSRIRQSLQIALRRSPLSREIVWGIGDEQLRHKRACPSLSTFFAAVRRRAADSSQKWEEINDAGRERYRADFPALFMGQTDTIWTASIVDPSLFPNLGPFQRFTTRREKPKGVKSVPVTTYNKSPFPRPFPAISIEFAVSGSTTPHKTGKS